MKLRLRLHRTLATRLWLAFIAGVAVPVAVLGALLVLVSERTLVQNAAGQSRQTIAQIARGIDEEARQIALWAAALSSDEQILASASRLAAGPTESDRALAAQALDRKMVSFFDYNNKIGSVQIFLHGRSPYIYRNSPFLFERPVDRADWFQEAARVPGRTRFVEDLRSHSLARDSHPLLSVAVTPAGATVRRNVELLLVSFRVASLETFFDGSADGRELVLFDAEGRPMLSSFDGVIAPGASPGEATRLLLDAISRSKAEARGGSSSIVSPEEASFQVNVRRKPYLVTVSDVPAPGWELVSAIPYSDITRGVDSFSRLARIALLLLLVIFVVYLEVSFLEVIRPLRQVIARMREVEGGDYSVAVDIRGPEEVVRLGSAFNSMVREVNRLTAEKESNQRERARLELESLRLQINPHFLSNTLNSIRLMAAMTNANGIQEMTRALMRVVNDSFGREGALDLVRNEIEMLESYVHIMKIRYGDNFSVSYDIAPEAADRLMLRMLLQPIVENSILHGFQGLPRRGRIDLSARIVSGSLVIAVADNGCGISEEALGTVFSPQLPNTPGLSRVGIANVARRIRLTHGEEYGLSIESSLGVGTKVTIRLPALSTGVDGVSRHDRR